MLVIVPANEFIKFGLTRVQLTKLVRTIMERR